MDLSFLPKRIFTAINLCDLDKLCEVRLRVGFPIILFLDGKKYALSTRAPYLIRDYEAYQKEPIKFNLFRARMQK